MSVTTTAPTQATTHAPATIKTGSQRLWTRDEVVTRILAGDTIFIRHGQVYRVPPSWLAAHPGGALAILHFVGRDASDEIDAYHSDHTLNKTMSRYIVGRVEIGKDGWEPLVPPVMSGWVRRAGINGKAEWHREASAVRSDEKHAIPSEILLVRREAVAAEEAPTLSTILPPPSTLSPAIQNQHSKAYRELHARVTAAGLYKTRYLAGYGPEIARYVTLSLLAAFTYYKGWFATSAVFLGCVWHQLTFTAHDLGHNGVTHNWVYDRLLGILIADLCGGLSIGWWVDNHNIHHLVTNHPSHDPDIQHIPFFAISNHFLSNLYSSYYHRIMPFDAFSKFFLKIQHRVYYLVMSLARFNLYANSYSFLFKRALDGRKLRWTWWLELVCIGIFWCWYGAVLKGCGSWRTALVYLLISHIVPSPLHVQIVLSHFARSTNDLGPAESFPDRQLRTTTDVICPPNLRFLHGGLDRQVTHHLFPRLPRHNLEAASKLVKEFAREQGLEYAEFGFFEGNGQVLDVLKGVANQVKIVGMVARQEAKDAVAGKKNSH